MPVLAVNVDHVATLRQQRRGFYPDPIEAALAAENAGATGIIAHLREDRRHILDRDIERMGRELKTHLHLEMAATEEMQSIALHARPRIVCLVPEKREELTTEGGLAVAGREDELRRYLEPLHEAGIQSSLFIEADPAQIKAAADVGCPYIEIHTGHFADAPDPEARKTELDKILDGVKRALDLDLKINLGHGLDYDNIMAFARTPGISEYSIGFGIVARAVFVGMHQAVAEMAAIIEKFPA
jgi:pyridoxine 5-phosphate synthase